uniref:Bestrophin homolog n=1 Tax=Macrostomum lignano TaxID=282301 RepID=A0A1I8FB36_9PLAT
PCSFLGNDEAPVLLRRTAIRYLIQAEKRFPTLQSLVDQGLMTENEFKLYNDEKVPHISSQVLVPTQWCRNVVPQGPQREKNYRLSPFACCFDVATLAVYVFYFNSIACPGQYVNFASVREEFRPRDLRQVFDRLVAEQMINPFGEDDDDFDVATGSWTAT